MNDAASNPARPQTSGQAPNAPKERAPKEGSKYSASLNLPQTEFAMRANLVQNEPASLERWTASNVYTRVQELRANAEPFVFHDGPPYANGSIHLGHLMNKCLKDFVVRSRAMAGRSCAYVPGWDCHGLPIEHKVMQDLVDSGEAKKLDGLDPWARKMKVREACAAYARKYHALHSGQMRRLLTMADYDHPYLTMQPSYEGATLEVLATLLGRGLVYRALKPVHWSVANETALAEAELEYYDREDLSVYVDFEAADAGMVYDAFDLPPVADDDEEDDASEGDDESAEDESEASEGSEERSVGMKPGVRPHVRPSFMIWTTTPWTLPANLAIAVNPKFEYALVYVDGNVTVMATDAIERVTTLAKSEAVTVLARTTGERLVGLRYRHPFVDPARSEGVHSTFSEAAPLGRAYPSIFTIVSADYVTLEDGTGLVHTAPGHGVEDYLTGQRLGLPVYCPVRSNGTYDATVPEWLRNKHIWKANAEVANHLKASGHMFHDHAFMHSYPHDWRGKSPVIFRCTEQWFVGVDRPFMMNPAGRMSGDGLSLRAAALLAVGDESRAMYDLKHTSSLDDWATQVPLLAGLSGFSGDSVEELRSRLRHDASRGTLKGCVEFVPEWGRNRMRGMLESRPDWCISRQRAWGLPIPAFEGPDGSVFMTAASVRAVANVVRNMGSDAWFTLTPAELLKDYDAASDPQLTDGSSGDMSWVRDAASRDRAAFLASLRKGNDILDVWFESGSSWNACMRERGLGYPVDLYLEGSDQHRGWFQLSMLPALGVTGRPPFKTLLTHGFINDKDGRKLSKSRPDAKDYEVDNLLAKYGADVLRWWVASLAYENDVKADTSFFDTSGEAYRKVRNTLRFLLSNLFDFECSTPPGAPPGKPGHCVSTEAMPAKSLDAWVLSCLNTLTQTVREAYTKYDFKTAQQALYDFCNDTLSAEYLAAVKDRLYCDKSDSPRRRQTQTALWDLADTLCKLMAPLLPHTADEAWRSLVNAAAHDPRTVHLETFPEAIKVHADPRWAEVFEAKALAKVALDRAKAELGVENPLDAGLILPDPAGDLSHFDLVDLADLMSVSEVTLAKDATEVKVVDLRQRPRCERSRKRDGTVKQRSDGGMLSDRDAMAVGVA